MNYDLHCHSTASDGLLAPADVVRRAAAKGVDVLALTDHDNLSGWSAAQAAAQQTAMRLVAGVEISTTWGGLTIHIVGLNIDPLDENLAKGLANIRASRARRAIRIAAEFDTLGIPGTLAGAYAYCNNPDLISRTHFARYLVATGHAADVKATFRHFLVPGKPGFVEQDWGSVADAVRMIRAAGGRAVVAHPGRYKLNPLQMDQMLIEFREAGGEGVEVVTGSHSPEQYAQYAIKARDFDLLASRGSDFHGPGESRVDLGQLPPLPGDLKPVWHDWG
jgi:predicted metal-dependent phosphoesterase TrpH